MIILLVVVLGPSLLIGTLAGAGGASIIAGFVALFSLLGAMGGSLLPDLRRLAVIGSLVAVGAVVPRLLGEVSVVAAFALIVLLVFVGCMLPLRGHQYDGVALALGMGTLFGYSFPVTGTVSTHQLVLTGVVGVAVALLLRTVLGLRDPGGPVRTAAAGLLDDPDADFARAFDTWSGDRPRRWLGDVLVAAGRYRLARRALARQAAAGDEVAVEELVRAEKRSAGLADAVRAKTPTSTPGTSEAEESARSVTSAESHSATGPVDPVTSAAAVAVGLALDDIEAADAGRDTTRVPFPPRFRLRMSLAALRSGIRHGSIQIRHAVRTSLAVLLALLVSLLLPPGDVLLPTLLMTTFALVQVSWRGTLTKARDRLLGLLVGGVLVVLVVLLLPPVALLPISLVGLAVGMWFITARPAVGVAGILVMSVGINTELRHLEPGHVIVEYVLLTLAAVLIGAVLGFVAIPGRRPPTIAVRVSDAVARTAQALQALGDDGSRQQPEATLRTLGSAQASIQELVPDREALSGEQDHQLDQLRGTLQDLLAMGMSANTTSVASPGRDVLGPASDVLVGDADPQPVAAPDNPLDAAVLLLAQDAAAQRTRIDLRPSS